MKGTNEQAKAVAARLPRSMRINGLAMLTATMLVVFSLIAAMPASAQGNSFTIGTRFGEVVCTSELAEDRKSLEVTCVGGRNKVVSFYRQFSDGTIEVVEEEGRIGSAVTKAILKSQGQGSATAVTITTFGAAAG